MRKLKDYRISQVPAAVRQYVDRHRALPAGEDIRWYEHEGMLWIATRHWHLLVGSAVEHVCTGNQTDYLSVYHNRKDFPTGAAFEKGETEVVEKTTAVRIGQAWVNANLLALVEDVHGRVTWHGADPLDMVQATKGGVLVGIVMPMRK